VIDQKELRSGGGPPGTRGLANATLNRIAKPSCSA
jgi:hypothetical protein